MRSLPSLTLGRQTLAFAAAAMLGATAHAATPTQELVYVGTHGLAPPGATAGLSSPVDKATQGIYQMRLDLKTGALTVPLVAYELDHAAALTPHPTLPIIYAAAAEAGSQTDSDIFSFKVDKANERLVMLNKADSGGHGTVAMTVDGSTSLLYAANYVSGSLSSIRIKDDGSLGDVVSTQTEIGSGPTPKQQSAHAHDVVISPDHRYALVTDLGADRIFIYRINPTTGSLTPAKVAAETVPLGSGPRHLAFHPGGKFVFVNTELTAEIRVYRWNGARGRLTPVQVVRAWPEGHTGDRSAAELVLSQDGRFAYLSLRGDQNSLIVYAVDATRGTLTEIQRLPSGGKTPWSFGIDLTGRYMLVANESSNTVVVLSVDPESGRLSTTGQSVTVPRPVSVAFYAE